MKKFDEDDPELATMAALLPMLMKCASKVYGLGLHAQAKQILTTIDEIALTLPEKQCADVRRATRDARMDIDRRNASLN